MADSDTIRKDFETIEEVCVCVCLWCVCVCVLCHRVCAAKQFDPALAVPFDRLQYAHFYFSAAGVSW